jgi:hypothetical protein
MESLTEWFHRQPRGQLIEVDSAFMMLSVYKLRSIGSCRYAGTERLGGWMGWFSRRSAACEHVPFHQCIRKSNGARVRILPSACASPTTTASVSAQP